MNQMAFILAGSDTFFINESGWTWTAAGAGLFVIAKTKWVASDFRLFFFFFNSFHSFYYVQKRQRSCARRPTVLK